MALDELELQLAAIPLVEDWEGHHLEQASVSFHAAAENAARWNRYFVVNLEEAVVAAAENAARWSCYFLVHLEEAAGVAAAWAWLEASPALVDCLLVAALHVFAVLPPLLAF